MDACTCAEHAETFATLVTNAAHWELELFIMVVVDGLALGLAWPFIRKHWKHHVKHDELHPETAKVCRYFEEHGHECYHVCRDGKVHWNPNVRPALAAREAQS